MKTSLTLTLSLTCLVALSSFGADSTPKEDIKAAAKKLAAKGSYSWKSSTENANPNAGGRGRPGPVEGKIDKEGFTALSMTRGENTTEAVLKDGKGAIKTADGWKSLSEAAEGDGGGGGGGQRNPTRAAARMLQNFKAPAAEAEDLADKAKDLKKADDVYSGELTEEGAKMLLTRNFRRPGAEAPSPTDPKGSIKFWVKDGVVTKYEFKVQGSMSFNGNDIQIDRTTTVEIKEIGSTKVDISEEAKKKLS